MAFRWCYYVQVLTNAIHSGRLDPLGTHECLKMHSLQEQVQALRADNAQLAHDLAEARAAMSAHAGHAQRADAQQLQREASLQAHVDEAKRGMATAQQRAEEARMERDFFMSQSTEAAGQAASATAERDAAKQVW